MATIQLLDDPGQMFVSDEEVQTGKLVRGLTWTAAAQLVNWLNFHGRKVMPYTRMKNNDPQEIRAVFPVDLPDYTTRYITVVVGVIPPTLGSGLVHLQLMSSTTDPTTTDVDAFAGSVAAHVDNSEIDLVYVAADIEVTGGNNELITIKAETADEYGVSIDGFGIWELPPKRGGVEVASDSGGLLPTVASIASTVTSVLDPKNYFTGAPVDTDLDTLQAAMDSAWSRNRRIVCSLGGLDWSATNGHAIQLGCGGTTGSWVSIFTGGIYIPAYMAGVADTKRNLRAAIAVKNANDVGTAQLRIKTSLGYYPTPVDSWSNPFPASLKQWRPWGDPFDPTADGIAFEVGLAAEWIEIELQEDTSAIDTKVCQIIIWEDDPP